MATDQWGGTSIERIRVRSRSIGVVLMNVFLTLNIIHTLFWFFINFEQVNAGRNSSYFSLELISVLSVNI